MLEIFFKILIRPGNHNRLMIALRGILFVVALVLCSTCGGLSTQQVQNRIDSEKALRDLDRFCTDLPKPNGFRLTGKRLQGNSDTWFIVHLFQADTQWVSVEAFMSEYFERLQWQKTEIVRDRGDLIPRGRVEFRDGKRFVTLDHVAFDDANFAIGCGADR